MVKSDTDMSPLSWSADDRFVAYRTRVPRFNIGVLSLKGDLAPYLFEAVTFVQGQGQISPNGRWLAYNANESARYEVNVQSFPKPGGGEGAGSERRRQLSPLAARRQRTVLLRQRRAAHERAIRRHHRPGDRRRSCAFRSRAWSTELRTPQATGPNTDVSPDGQRFLLNVPIDPSLESPITVVMNWLSLIRQ